ncbi:hypothetical protein [Flavisolibacter ginsengisoli]|uniref:Dolichyl-phosphate-mannose-protein mannosyltransferase n=1 Tax=Flavisolibacter ginsengisoli DSM 18119 TaxID=1121884 RepID=A0A1M4VI22_9BACT|nr:hypothetical protein [Flavisolibacter ginsengisoli]SHE68473.1 hypothetical protein SAMN02745131_00861 [Flavisolibacter ginsengisoli DSM 18119]
MQYLTIWDLVLTPIYLFILIALAKNQRDKRYPVGHPLRKYYLPGLYVKFGGAIFIALVYQFYYGGGDTFNFFHHSQVINSALDDSVSNWLDLLFRRSPDVNPQLYKYTSQLEWYNDRSSYFVAIFGSIFGLFNGTSYIPIALLFAYFSFTGVWAMYRTFVNLYPKLHKELAIAFLFIPSTFVWGSAMFKDTVCMFGLGWLTYTTFRIFVNRDFSIKNLLMLGVSFYLIAVIKLYILLAFLPALALWLLLTYSHKIKTIGLRWMVNLLFVAITVGGFFFLSKRFASEMNKYSLENVASTAAETRGWIAYSSGDEGSAYDLGAFDPSLLGMLTKFPQAVVVTLFRPFIWESKKIIVLLSGLEALLFLYFTLKVIAKRKTRIFSMVIKDPNLSFCLVFSIIFAFAVGISSYNFGALSRYKIPCLPFYAASLIILYYNFEIPTVLYKKSYLKSSKNKSALT